MGCVADIRRLAYKVKGGNQVEGLDEAVANLCCRLQECQRMSDNESVNPTDSLKSIQSGQQATPSQYHLKAFIAATHIYLYQSIFDLPPRILRPYVAEVFQSIELFYLSGGGNLSLWPAFIAALEAYEEPEVSAAKSWLQTATSVGIGSRHKAKAVIERVWNMRAVTSKSTGQDVGFIVVNWQQAMIDLDMDILLV